jgi:hypothetical protein
VLNPRYGARSRRRIFPLNVANQPKAITMASDQKERSKFTTGNPQTTKFKIYL